MRPSDPPAQAWRRPAILAVSLLVSLTTCLALTGPALGQDYPPGKSAPSVTQTVVEPGGTIGVRFPGFCARRTITISLERGGFKQRVTDVIANGAGDVSVRVRIPAGTASGAYLVVARGLATDCVHPKVSHVGIEVDPPGTAAAGGAPTSVTGSTAPAGGLPLTGLDLGVLLLAGAVVLAAGLLLRRLSRSRSTR